MPESQILNSVMERAKHYFMTRKTIYDESIKRDTYYSTGHASRDAILDTSLESGISLYLVVSQILQETQLKPDEIQNPDVGTKNYKTWSEYLLFLGYQVVMTQMEREDPLIQKEDYQRGIQDEDEHPWIPPDDY